MIGNGTGWRLTEANASFALSKTYPEVLVVPESTDDRVLQGAAEFRSKVFIMIT